MSAFDLLHFLNNKSAKPQEFKCDLQSEYDGRLQSLRTLLEESPGDDLSRVPLRDLQRLLEIKSREHSVRLGECLSLPSNREACLKKVNQQAVLFKKAKVHLDEFTKLKVKLGWTQFLKQKGFNDRQICKIQSYHLEAEVFEALKGAQMATGQNLKEIERLVLEAEEKKRTPQEPIDPCRVVKDKESLPVFSRDLVAFCS